MTMGSPVRDLAHLRELLSSGTSCWLHWPQRDSSYKTAPGRIAREHNGYVLVEHWKDQWLAYASVAMFIRQGTAPLESETLRILSGWAKWASGPDGVARYIKELDMKRSLAEDRLCGHKFFDSALQLVAQAREHERQPANVVVDWREVKRLYRAAIADTEGAIKSIEADAQWAKDAAHWLVHMRTQLSSWQGHIHSMP